MEGLFQPTHLLLIFAIALLIFGPKKLPELGKGIGEGFRALKEGMKDKPAEPTASVSTSAPAPTNTTTEVKS
jgi:sec-independent protein translocase protein TatA